MKLRFKPLDQATMILHVFVDSGYNTDIDRTKHLEICILRVYESKRCFFFFALGFLKEQTTTKFDDC